MNILIMLGTSELLLYNKPFIGSCEINKLYLVNKFFQKNPRCFQWCQWANVSFKIKAEISKYHIVLMFSDAIFKFISTMAEIYLASGRNANLLTCNIFLHKRT